MRRPVMYLAGLLLATGASFALAGPASAAVSHDSHATAVAGDPFGDEFSFTSVEDSLNRYNGASQTGIFLLSPMGNGGNLLPILSGPFS
jgi:hypothetical protein